MNSPTETPMMEKPLRRGEGYLLFMAYMQVAAGVLTVVFSLVAMAQMGFVVGPEMLNPVTAADTFGGRATGTFDSLIAGYMVFQVSFGWIFGLLLIAAGVCCLRCKGAGFVKAVAILNLLNFPHGTTIALMMLHGFGRPGIVRAFRYDS